LLPPKAEGHSGIYMESRKSSVEELIETQEGHCEFIKEELAFGATEKIAELMELTGVSKSDLAKRTGSSKAHITQVLSGSRNITVHTLAGLAFALGYKITLSAAPIGREIVSGRGAVSGH
jgi:antitoxin component HigA of HigAB toxin-antitoxin module